MRTITILSLTILIIAGCSRNNEDPSIEPTPYFDFATTQDYSLYIDYNNPMHQTPIPFSIYEQNPLKSNGALRDDIQEPIYKGVTQPDGTFQSIITLPTHVETLYLYAHSVGVASLLISQRQDAMFSFDPQSSVQAKAEPLYNSHTPLVDIIGSWYNGGLPSYLLLDQELPNELIQDINASLPNRSVPVYHPEYLQDGNISKIVLVEDADLEIIFISEGAGYLNTLGYYHYPTNQPPTSMATVRKSVLFPNVSFNGSGGRLRSGNRVRLQYWNGTSYQDRFPAGTTVEWFIMADSYKMATQSIENTTTYYSDPQFNPERSPLKRQHTLVLHDTNRELFLVSFEDLNRENGSDEDFNDAIFYTKATPYSAVQTAGLPLINQFVDRDSDGVGDDMDEFPSDPTLAYRLHYPAKDQYGTIAFEDLWPNRGDYDLNDLVIEYNSILYLSASNLVVKVEDRFRPKHSGASFRNGFGYQLGLTPSQVSKVTISGGYPVRSAFPMTASGIEAGQSKATIILFDDMNQVVSSHRDQPITVTTVPAVPVSLSQLTTPPYNPFIIIGAATGDRGREIHLTNKRPTDLANSTLLGTAGDKSNPTRGLYYISDNRLPFAIHIPISFTYPAEKQIITDVFPNFAAWAASNGALYTTWYRNRR